MTTTMVGDVADIGRKLVAELMRLHSEGTPNDTLLLLPMIARAVHLTRDIASLRLAGEPKLR